MVAVGSEGVTYIQTRTRLNNPKLSKTPWTMQHKHIINRIALVVHPDEGFVVASSGGEDRVIHIQTKTRLNDSLLSRTPWLIQNNDFVWCIALISHPEEGFVVASGGHDCVTRIQTQTRLNDPMLSNIPWEIQHEGSVTCVALITHPDEGFVVASGGWGTTCIQTRTRLNDPQLSKTPWKIQHKKGRAECVALISHPEEGFVVASGGCGATLIQTQTRLNDPLLSNIPWEIQCDGVTRGIALISHPEDGFVVASGGGGATCIQTRTRLTDPVLSQTPWKIQHKIRRWSSCVALIAHQNEGFVVASWEGDDVIHIQTQMRLNDPLLSNMPWEIQQRGADCVALIAHPEEGFVVALRRSNGVAIHTQMRLKDLPPSKTLWKIQHEGKSSCVALIAHPDEGFVVASLGVGGEGRDVHIQTQMRLSDPLLRNMPWMMKHKSNVECITLITHPEEGFVIASGGREGVTYIQTRTRLNDLQLSKTPWVMQQQHDFRVNSVALIAHPNEGFVVASGGRGGVTQIQTRTRLNDPELSNTPWMIQHEKGVECVALIAHPNEGFVVASGGRDNVVRIQTQTRLNDPLLSNTPWETQHQPKGRNNPVEIIFLMLDHIENFVVFSFIDQPLNHQSLYVASYSHLIKGYKPFREKIPIKGVVKKIDQIVFNNDKKIMLFINREGMFHFKERGYLKFTQKIPNYMAHAHFFHEGKLRFYIARRVPTGVVIFEYEVQNLPKEN